MESTAIFMGTARGDWDGACVSVLWEKFGRSKALQCKQPALFALYYNQKASLTSGGDI